MTAVLDRVERALTKRMASWADSSGELIGTPWDLSDGEPLVLGIQEIGDGVYNVTDRGMLVSSLTTAGVDFGRKGAVESLKAVTRSIGRSPLLGHRPHEFEIGASADADTLGDVVVEVGQAALRADALRALAPKPRRARFDARIIRIAGEVDLTVQPRAQMPLRFAGRSRPVSCQVIGKSGNAFVQAIGSGANTGAAYDHARAIFADAEMHVTGMAAIEGGAHLDDWQRVSLGEVSTVVEEADLRDQFEQLAAA